jgi:hypothetical protein
MDSFYTEFSKVLDRVRPCLLFNKMSSDVEPARCQWLRSYFSGKIHRIIIGCCVSRDILVTSDFPQGSHFEPLCFIWFVNEIDQIFDYVRVLKTRSYFFLYVVFRIARKFKAI